MNVSLDHTDVQFMLHVETQLVHTHVPVTLALPEMEKTVLTLMNVLLNHMDAHLLQLVPIQLVPIPVPAMLDTKDMVEVVMSLIATMFYLHALSMLSVS